ncbi:MAG: DUF58 domain-containing protein [Alphaproteobacteria bacterium]|nr:DUF58 domain-containing protein [Alphaproteobacteria bacterium]
MAVTQANFRQRAEQLAAHLPPLLVAAERVAAVVAQGVHGRRRVGAGETFWQFRPYHPGDEVNRIDWRQTAKSTRVLVRENEWEAAESVWLWHDTSASMRFASHPAVEDKADRARLLLLALAVLLVRGGEHVALLGHDRRAATGRGTLARMTAALTRDDGPGASLPPRIPLPRYAQLVIIGDLLSPIEDIAATIRHFSGQKVRGHLFQILDPAEETLPFAGHTLFEGLEDEGVLLARRAEDLRRDYTRRMAAHRDAIAGLTRAARWRLGLHHTDQPAQAALLSLYMSMAGHASG